MPARVRPFRAIAVAAAFTAASIGCVVAVRRHHHLRRVLLRERAAHRLKDGCLHRDLQAFQTRIDGLMAQGQRARCVLGEADLVLDDALASHRIDPYDPYTEGGPG